MTSNLQFQTQRTYNYDYSRIKIVSLRQFQIQVTKKPKQQLHFFPPVSNKNPGHSRGFVPCNLVSFQSPLGHAQGVTLSVMIQDGSILQMEEGMMKKEQGAFFSYFFKKFLRSYQITLLLISLWSEFGHMATQLHGKLENVEIQTLFWMIWCPAKTSLTIEKQKTDMGGISSNLCYTVLNVFRALFLRSYWESILPE